MMHMYCNLDSRKRTKLKCIEQVNMSGPSMRTPEGATYRVQGPLLFPDNSRRRRSHLMTRDQKAKCDLPDCCKERVYRQETQIGKQEQECVVQG